MSDFHVLISHWLIVARPRADGTIALPGAVGLREEIARAVENVLRGYDGEVRIFESGLPIVVAPRWRVTAVALRVRQEPLSGQILGYLKKDTLVAELERRTANGALWIRHDGGAETSLAGWSAAVFMALPPG